MKTKVLTNFEDINKNVMAPLVRKVVENPVIRPGYEGYEVVETMSPLQDSIGLYHDWPTAAPDTGRQDAHGSGNGLLYSSHVAVCVWNLSRKSQKVFRPFLKTVQNGVSRCQISPGFYKRHPKFYSTDQISHDDLIGLATISSFSGGKVAGEIAAFGINGYKTVVTIASLLDLIPPTFLFVKKALAFLIPQAMQKWAWEREVSWYFPNEEKHKPVFNQAAWLWRFFAARHHIYRCAGMYSRTVYEWMWCLSLFTARDSNSMCLAWNMTQAARNFSRLEQYCVKKFLARVDMKMVFTHYFKWPHPLSLFADLKLEGDEKKKYTGQDIEVAYFKKS